MITDKKKSCFDKMRQSGRGGLFFGPNDNTLRICTSERKLYQLYSTNLGSTIVKALSSFCDNDQTKTATPMTGVTAAALMGT